MLLLREKYGLSFGEAGAQAEATVAATDKLLTRREAEKYYVRITASSITETQNLLLRRD